MDILLQNHGHIYIYIYIYLCIHILCMSHMIVHIYIYIYIYIYMSLPQDLPQVLLKETRATIKVCHGPPVCRSDPAAPSRETWPRRGTAPPAIGAPTRRPAVCRLLKAVGLVVLGGLVDPPPPPQTKNAYGLLKIDKIRQRMTKILRVPVPSICIISRHPSFQKTTQSPGETDGF